MATEVDQAYHGWSHQELYDCDASQEVSVSQMLDHGSVSFGRFAVETLSWEKKSVFTRNRRQEELEKYRTHGLVAQKKAYFEEYFKRIRAVKSLQDNHQSETTVNHGDYASISGQSGEENKTAEGLKCHGDRTAHVGNDHLEDGTSGVSLCHSHLEKLATGVALGNATHRREALQASPSSSRKSLEENKGESYTNYAIQMQHLDPKLMMDEACIRSEPNIDHHDISSLDCQRVSDRSVKLSCNDKPPIAATDTTSFARNPKPERSPLTQVENATREKTSQIMKTYKKESMSVPNLKKPPSVTNNLNLGCKRKSELKPSNGLNPAQRTIFKAENNTHTRNAAADKLSSNYKSTSVSSCKPLTVYSKVTTPRPFSFVTGKRAAVPSSLRDGTSRLISKSLNGAASSLTHEKDIILVQSASEKATIANGEKGNILVNKRGYGKGMPLVPDRRHTGLKRKGATMLGSSKARSINPLLGNKSNPCSESDNQSNHVARGNRGEAGQHKAKLVPKIQGVSSRNKDSVLTKNLKEENRKTFQSRTSNLSPLNTRKLQSSDASLNAKKPRKEMPRWR